MTKLKYLYVFLMIFSYPGLSKSQYILQPAFPQMPDYSYPVEIANANDGSNRLFVVERKGKIRVFNNNSNASSNKVFLDITNKVVQTNVTGLFGLAFHPDYKNNRYFFVYYIYDSLGFAGSNRWMKVSRFTTSPTNPDSAIKSSEVNLITTLGGTFHFGGKIAFGPDGYLYISFGDGPSSPSYGQDKTNLLGKILRINVDSSSGGKNYSIPESNPFYGNISGYKEEIYAYGLRNPWKFSFDLPTNRLWLGDVGDGSYEEIDIIENGKNYGWDKMEGFHCKGVCDTTGRGFTRPVWEYPHSGSFIQSVTGGYVYRGEQFPELAGKYIYADYIDGTIWSLNYDGINPSVNTQLFDTNFYMVSFGVDEQKELYVLSYAQINPGLGRIYKLVNKNVNKLSIKSVIQGLYDNVNNMLILRDTSYIYLHSVISPYIIIDSAKCVTDSLTYTGLSFFNNAPSDKYYIVVKHRNSIETWSRAGGDSILTGKINSYDFTDDASKAFGSNLVLIGSKYCIYTGDVNQDGVIDADDVSLIDNALNDPGNSDSDSDLNGDKIIDAADISIVENNLYLYVMTIAP